MVLYVLVGIFNVLDFVTGLIKAFKTKTFNSSIMREGLFNKCAILICLVFGVLLDYTQRFIDIGVTIPVGTALCAYIILMESGSIAENIGQINPQIVPGKLKAYFEKIS